MSNDLTDVGVLAIGTAPLNRIVELDLEQHTGAVSAQALDQVAKRHAQAMSRTTT